MYYIGQYFSDPFWVTLIGEEGSKATLDCSAGCFTSQVTRPGISNRIRSNHGGWDGVWSFWKAPIRTLKGRPLELDKCNFYIREYSPFGNQLLECYCNRHQVPDKEVSNNNGLLLWVWFSKWQFEKVKLQYCVVEKVHLGAGQRVQITGIDGPDPMSPNFSCTHMFPKLIPMDFLRSSLWLREEKNIQSGPWWTGSVHWWYLQMGCSHTLSW